MEKHSILRHGRKAVKTEHTDLLSFMEQAQEDREVADHDPLGCDAFIANELPVLNVCGNVKDLVRRTEVFASVAISLKSPSRVNSLAILRDLGLLAASLSRHNFKPDNCKQLSPALIKHAQFTEEVPRDTVFSYASRNPSGPRLRRFTDLTDETVLIQGFRLGISTMGDCISSLLRAYRWGPSHKNFAPAITKAEGAFNCMSKAVVTVRQKIKPETMVLLLRPFFYPYEVGGTTYVGAGGAQIPVSIVDSLVWADSNEDSDLYHFRRQNHIYQPRSYRKLADRLEGLPCLVSRVETASQQRTNLITLGTSARALASFIVGLERFRFPHKKLTDANMRVSADGAYQAEIAEKILARTVQARLRIDQIGRHLPC